MELDSQRSEHIDIRKIIEASPLREWQPDPKTLEWLASRVGENPCKKCSYTGNCANEHQQNHILITCGPLALHLGATWGHAKGLLEGRKQEREKILLRLREDEKHCDCECDLLMHIDRLEEYLKETG